MNLTLCIASLSRGGAEKNLAMLANACASDGHEVHVLTFEAPGVESAYPLESSIRRDQLDLLKHANGLYDAIRLNLRRVRVIRQALRRNDSDVVVSFIHEMNVLVLLATWGLRSPVVVAERVDPLHHRPSVLWRLLRWVTYRFARTLVVQTPEVVDRYPVSVRHRCRVIPNAISSMPAESSSEEKPGAGHRPVIVGMGRLVAQKGFDLLLRAFADVAADFPNWRLCIWGEGASRAELVGLREDLALDEQQVAFEGHTSKPFAVLRQADLFVLSSRYEGFPNALVEAMACGLPVISFDCPSGPARIIRNGVDGVLVEPEDVQSLAKAMRELMADEAERLRLGAAALQVADRYSEPGVMTQWRAVLAEAAEA